jgi:hypothetical protein
MAVIGDNSKIQRVFRVGEKRNSALSGTRIGERLMSVSAYVGGVRSLKNRLFAQVTRR